jgi:predicted transcriptional regulator
MAQESAAQKVDPSLIADIVQSYFAKNTVAVDQLASLITTVHPALSGLGTAPPLAAKALTPAVPIRRSVQQDHVICLECGFRGKTLRRHLRLQHGLEVAAYRARWKLPPDHPVTAPAYSERRSAMTKQLGFGRQRVAPVAEPLPPPTPPPTPPPMPRRRSSRRPT